MTLEEDLVTLLIKQALDIDGYELSIDLARRTVKDGRGFSASFLIDAFQRDCLLQGLDDIGLTLLHESDIAAYELKRPTLIR